MIRFSCIPMLLVTLFCPAIEAENVFRLDADAAAQTFPLPASATSEPSAIPGSTATTSPQVETKGNEAIGSPDPATSNAPAAESKDPEIEPQAIASTLIYGAAPDLVNGNNVVVFLQADDFFLSVTTTIQSVRFWTLESSNQWDSECQFAIYTNSGGAPNNQIITDSVTLRRTQTGRQSQGLNEFVNEFDLPTPVRLNSGTYWLGLHMNASCLTSKQIFWETGTPGFSNDPVEDSACNGGWNLTQDGREHAFMLYGVTTMFCQDLVHPTVAPVLTNQIGDADRGVSFSVNNTVRSSSIGVLVDFNSNTTLTAYIRSVTGSTLGGILAQASIAVTAGGPRFFDVPLSFTFNKGQRYDISFNITGGWDLPSNHLMSFQIFNNSSLSSASGFNAGPFRVLDGRSALDGYANTALPQMRICLTDDSFDAVGLNVTNEDIVGFDLDAPDALTQLAMTPPGDHLVGVDVRPANGTTTLYMLNATDNKMMTYNRQTGVLTNLSSNTNPFGSELFTGLSFDPTSGVLYACGSRGDTTQSSLYTINITTGAATRIGRTTGSDGLIGIAVSQSGVMYGIDVNNNNLVTINKTTAATTAVGLLGVNIAFTQGIDFDPVSGVLYGTLYNSSNSRGEFYTIDTNTGQATFVGVLGQNVPGSVVDLSSMAVLSDATPTPAPTATPSPTASPTTTASPSPSPTPSPSATVTPSPTPSASPTPSPSNTPSPTPSPTPFNDALYNSDTFPTQMNTNQGLHIGITMLNTGNTTWTSGANYALVIQSDPCSLFANSRLDVDSFNPVSPSELNQFIGYAVAPGAPTNCSVSGQMVEGVSAFFGQTFNANIAIIVPPNAARRWENYE